MRHPGSRRCASSEIPPPTARSIDNVRFEESVKQRLVVLTDISNEPDDEQSLVRLLVYASDFGIEGLVATTSVHLRGGVRPDLIRRQVVAYGEVLPTLRRHAPDYPSAESLLELVEEGPSGVGMKGVGDGCDTGGSERVIAAVDREDPRPVWVTLWGGANCLAQALWKVRRTRSQAEVDAFVEKIRVYAISDQDDSAMRLRETFPGLFYIVSPRPYHTSTWYGVKGVCDVPGGDASKIELSALRSPRREACTGVVVPSHPGTQWVVENIRTGHGPLGELYPETKYGMEGDTPSYLGLIRNGLNFHENPKYGGWGGRYELQQPGSPALDHYKKRYPDYPYTGETRPIWTDVDDTFVGVDGKLYTHNLGSVARWRDAFQDDFAARMDWCVTARYANANHNPIAAFRGHCGRETVHLDAAPGDLVTLSAEGSSDPDGDGLEYAWTYYREAGTFQGEVNVDAPSACVTTMRVPKGAAGSEVQILLEVRDDGCPSLRSYRRIVIHVA